MSQGIAVEGLRLVKENLPVAFAEPENLAARANMMSAAMMGATAFQKGLGAIHAISHPIGAMHNTHHGTTNAVVMVEVLKFNRSAIEDRITVLNGYLGISGGFDGFVGFVSNLNQSLGIPESLSALGVEDPNLERLLAGALSDPSTGGNPIEMTETNTRSLLQAVLN
jgi:alcohol dehydrogenase class IV